MTMTNAVRTLAGLSDEAKRAIAQADGRHQGQAVHLAETEAGAAVRGELYRVGAIGEANGLTRFGSILAERIRDAALEAAFG